jgi:AcrR family transcriptional regulator
MIQPSVFSRDQIIDAAFELIRERGWQEVSTRAIAKKMGCSTMPIYSHMRSVRDLKEELLKKGRRLMKEYQTRSHSKEPLLNLAVGYVVFAREEKNLFRFLYLDQTWSISMDDLAGMRKSFMEDFGEDTPAGAGLAGISRSGQEGLIRSSWIFTHGLAMLVHAGVFEDCSNETIERFLADAGGAFYLWETQKGVET